MSIKRLRECAACVLLGMVCLFAMTGCFDSDNAAVKDCDELIASLAANDDEVMQALRTSLRRFRAFLNEDDSSLESLPYQAKERERAELSEAMKVVVTVQVALSLIDSSAWTETDKKEMEQLKDVRNAVQQKAKRIGWAL